MKGDDLDRRMEELRLKHLPPQVVDPWRRRAERELPGWDASIMPLVEESAGQVIYTLKAENHVGAVNNYVLLTGPHQDELINQAQVFTYYWEHIEEHS